MTPAGPRAAAARLGILAGYSAGSGLIGTLILVEGFGYLPGHSAAVFGLGTLVVFAVGAFASALESLFGIVGGFLALALFVVLGNPSAGGPWPMDMMNEPWRSVGPWIPNGAALTALRQVLNLDGHAIAGPLWVLAGYAAVGASTLGLLARRGRPFLDLSGGATCVVVPLVKTSLARTATRLISAVGRWRCL